MERVLVLAPNPLSAPSPGGLTGPAFALDSLFEAGRVSGLLEGDETALVVDDESAPVVLYQALGIPHGGGI